MIAGEMNEYGNSVWSDAWNLDDLKVMEYAADLKVRLMTALCSPVLLSHSKVSSISEILELQIEIFHVYRLLQAFGGCSTR